MTAATVNATHKKQVLTYTSTRTRTHICLLYAMQDGSGATQLVAFANDLENLHKIAFRI